MKKIKLVGLFIVSGLIALLSPLHAQTTTISIQSLHSASADNMAVMLQAVEATTPLPAESVPTANAYYSAQNPAWPPLPCNINNVPVWNLGDGALLLADLDINYSQRPTASSMTAGRMGAMAVPSPGDGSGDYANSYVSYTFDTNSLWLEITNVANGLAYLNLHNATNQVYAIWDTTNLLTGWNVEMEAWPTNPAVMPFVVPTLERQNLFVQAEDWTGVTENGNTTPDWWFWEYFGTVALSDTNLDSQGNTFLYDYQNGLNPNIINFFINVTNSYVNTSYPNLQLAIFGGVPSYEAVLVNDTNMTDAVWQPYTGSNIVATLGADGNYNVSVGLRGLPSDATETWQSVALTKNTVAPLIVVTNPVSGTVSVPMIQLQGFANESLSSLTFDISNAANIFTNQTGYLTGQFWDTNLLAFTMNYFQCYDIALTNGLNQITLHATDLAGNATTTNFSFTLDYSGDTNPPLLNLVWPQDGAQIGGANFTLQAQVDDATATVTAQIADTNGDTNIVQGLVERDGTVWVQNLPLNGGTNTLTLTATDAAGNMSVTSISVSQSAVTVTIDPLGSDQFNQSSVTVTGTVSDPSDSVRVNSVAADVDSETGDWEADNVPVSPTGTAIFDVEIYTGDPVLVGSQFFNQVQPPMVILSGFTQRSASDSVASTVQWNYVGGGSWSYGPGYGGGPIPPDGDGYTPPVVIPYYPYIFAPPWQNANATYYDGNSYQTSVKTTGMIVPSDPKLPGVVQLYMMSASAMMFVPLIGFPDGGDASFFVPCFLTPLNQGNVLIPPEHLLINGQPLVGVTNDDGSIWGKTVISAPAEALVPLTMTTANLDYNDYTFNVQAFDITPRMLVDNNRDGSVDTLTTPNSPYRFWVNDSQESGDISTPNNDVPGSSSPNYANSQVNGRCDLINFFPVALCLSNVLQLLPPTDGWEYHLSQADNAVKFVYTSLTQSNAFDYLTDATATDGYGVNADEAPQSADTIPVLPSRATGTKLDTNWLAQVQNNGGVGIILMEGCATTTQPLMLELWHNGQKLGGVPLYLSISGVEAMFRQINLRDGYTGIPAEPLNYPGRFSNGKQFVFVHGYNVNATQARGWNAEMFKRLYQSRSRAMFTGVDWQGDDGQIPVIGITPDYYVNVIHAFDTALYFSMAMRDLPGGKYIAAHSLGNMVVSSAIADWSQSSTVGFQYNAYFMIDAAVAMEAYDTSFGDNTDLVPPLYWPNYNNNLWASEWFSLFSNDSRTNLTWQNRFGNIPNAYNYYSSTEDVLADADGQMHSIYANQYAWVNQEMNKGTWPLPLSLIVNNEAGWGFNSSYDIFPGGLRTHLPPDQAALLPDSQLQTNSFFGWFDDSTLYDPNAGSAEAAKASVREKVLSDGIPALSNPAGGNFLGINFGVPNADRNMNGYKGLNINGLWPRSGDDWEHSDIVNIAYPFNRAVFNQIVTDGGLR